jgi:hypothetical protein
VSRVGGQIGSDGDLDWYTFNVDLQQIQSIPNVSANNAASFPFVFDIDYADGLVRSDTTLAVYRQQGDQAVLMYVGRESNLQDDRAAITQQDLLDNGSFSEYDPFIGPVYLPEGNGVTYYTAVMSNQRLPNELGGTFLSNPTQPNLRLEPINSVTRIVEDHIGSSGYMSGMSPVLPETDIFDISSSVSVGLHVQPLTLRDVRMYLSQSNSERNGQLRIAVPLISTRSGNLGPTTDLQDIHMRTDGTLWGYAGNDTDNDDTNHNVSNTAGTLQRLDAGTGAVIGTGTNDAIRGPQPPATIANFG